MLPTHEEKENVLWVTTVDKLERQIRNHTNYFSAMLPSLRIGRRSSVTEQEQKEDALSLPLISVTSLPYCFPDSGNVGDRPTILWMRVLYSTEPMCKCVSGLLSFIFRWVNKIFSERGAGSNRYGGAIKGKAAGCDDGNICENNEIPRRLILIGELEDSLLFGRKRH